MFENVKTSVRQNLQARKFNIDNGKYLNKVQCIKELIMQIVVLKQLVLFFERTICSEASKNVIVIKH